jgi:ATP-dependent DNA helicase DinG
MSEQVEMFMDMSDNENTDAPRMQLIEKFKAVENSVLLGTESFWTGVDVPGPSLSCLLIDKIPFPTPGDPVLDAIQEAAGGFHKSFWKISVPRAVLQLRQGVGRLIRSRSDKGVLVILDNRLVTKGYGSVFTDSLPPMRRGSGIRNGEITKWLES